MQSGLRVTYSGKSTSAARLADLTGLVGHSVPELTGDAAHKVVDLCPGTENRLSELSGQLDSAGKMFEACRDRKGRPHQIWLHMPRLTVLTGCSDGVAGVCHGRAAVHCS